ncbi:MAG TPA: hypothetical protein DIC23_03785 [Planctomycetaceae bacterium]|nr:hypothetical protein [Planctomycetaceae bacterium]
MPVGNDWGSEVLAESCTWLVAWDAAAGESATGVALPTDGSGVESQVCSTAPQPQVNSTNPASEIASQPGMPIAFLLVS